VQKDKNVISLLHFFVKSKSRTNYHRSLKITVRTLLRTGYGGAHIFRIISGAHLSNKDLEFSRAARSLSNLNRRADSRSCRSSLLQLVEVYAEKSL